MDHVIEAHIPPGDLITSEDSQKENLQRQKIGQHLNNQRPIADIAAEIKVDKEGDIQGKGKKENIGEEKEGESLEVGWMKKFFY